MPDNQNSSEWVMVPRVPTRAMRDAAYAGTDNVVLHDGVYYIDSAAVAWDRMLAAAPPAPAMLNGVEYDRELIARMLDELEPIVGLQHIRESVAEQARLLRAADNRDAAGVVVGNFDDLMAERETITPGITARVNARAKEMKAEMDLPPGCVTINDYIAECEKDPEMKARLDAVRARRPRRNTPTAAPAGEAVAAALRFLGELETVGNMKAAEVARDLRKLYTHPPAAEAVTEVPCIYCSGPVYAWAKDRASTVCLDCTANPSPAFMAVVVEARRVWMVENPCEDGRDHVTPFDRFLYTTLPVSAQRCAQQVQDGKADHAGAGPADAAGNAEHGQGAEDQGEDGKDQGEHGGSPLTGGASLHRGKDEVKP